MLTYRRMPGFWEGYGVPDTQKTTDTETDVDVRSLFAEVDLPEEIGEKNRELGLDRLQVGREDTEENAGYLTLIAAIGNQSMLELLGRRLDAGEAGRKKAPTDFAEVRRALDKVLEGCREEVDRDSFPQKYSDMVVRYSELMAACSTYASAHAGGGKRRFFSSEKGADKLRLAQVEEIGRVAGREFTIIRARGTQMALSANGVTWWELFASQARERDVGQTRAEAELRREEEEERRRYETAGIDFDTDEAAEFFRYKKQLYAEGKPVRHLTLDYFGALKQEYRALKQERQQKSRGEAPASFTDFLKMRDEEEPEKQEEKPGEKQTSQNGETSEGGETSGEEGPEVSENNKLRSELESLRARMDAPKLRVMTPEERTAWQHGSFTAPPFVMTPQRFRELLPKRAFMSEDMSEELSERVIKLLERLNFIPENATQAAPPSKRVARLALEQLREARGEYELIELICAQCEAVESYEPPKPEQTDKKEEEGEEAPTVQEANPFLTSGRTLDCSLEHLNRMISAQSRGDTKLDRVFVRQLFEMFREYGRLQADVRDPNRHFPMGILERELLTETAKHLDNPIVKQIHDAVGTVRREAAERLKIPDHTKDIEADTDALMSPENLLLWCSGLTQKEGFTPDVLSEIAVELNKLHEAKAKSDWVESEFTAPLGRLKELMASYGELSPALTKLSKQCRDLELLISDQSKYPQEVRKQAKRKEEREAALAKERARELDRKVMPVERLRGALVKELNTGAISPSRLNDICASMEILRALLQGESPSKGAVAAAARAVASLAYGTEEFGILFTLVGQCEAIARELEPWSRETEELSLHMQRLRSRRESSREAELSLSELFRLPEEE
jgi:hypothetical protein